MNTPVESKSQERSLTTTSYAILAVLALRPHATYDLAKQMQLSLRYMWPRAESNLYAEPKRLVAAGLAEATEEWNGSRRRTIYRITDAGREALAAWVASPSAAPRFESEALVKIFFAEHGTKEALLANLAALEQQARAGVAHFAALADTYAEGRGQYPDRFALSALTARLLGEQQALLLRWAAWAAAAVAEWEDTHSPAPSEWGVAAMRSIGTPFEEPAAPLSGGS